MSLKESLRLLETMTPVLPMERIPLADALNRVLARPFVAPFDMPTFCRSAMDGYAVRAADTADASPTNPITLRIMGKILAGSSGEMALKEGTACRIATGGAVPEGADAVLRQEDVEVTSAGHLIVTHAVEAGKDVVTAGTDAHHGQQLLPTGWWLGANDLALMAALGAAHADVIRQPRVAYVETGDELVSPGEALPRGHIYGSNTLMLSLRAQQHGASVVAQRRVVDDLAEMVDCFEQLLDTADVVVSTGGVSVGPKDFVPEVLRSIGCEQLFHGLPIRPGHPIFAAHRNNKLWIGLAGNPTAALVTHEFFVRPILWRMAGLRFSQGFNPAFRVGVKGPALKRQRRTSFYLGQLRLTESSPTVIVDRKRRPTSSPAPFEFNSIVQVEPESDEQADDCVERVVVYPADKSVAAASLTRFPWSVGGILLAGGQSRRMGHSKLFLPLEGIPLIVRAYRALAAICAEVRIIGAPADAIDLLAQWEGEAIRKSCFPDERPGEGPLAGLITGLRHTPEPMALCLATDLPFVNGTALGRLLDHARHEVPSLDTFGSPPNRGFVLSDGDEKQPLAALYPTTRSLAVAEQLWGDGGRAMYRFVSLLGVEDVPVDHPATLTNVNRPDEYRAAREAFHSGQASGAPASNTASQQDDSRDLPPLLAFSGHSGSGKTTLISRLIPLLKERGLRVVVIKHGHRFELDKPGKDSWRFKEAGADGVLLFSAEEMAYMVRPGAPLDFDDLVDKVKHDADVILVEGFKAHPIPKIVVLRDDETWQAHPLSGDPHVQAIYGGLSTEGVSVPIFARTPVDDHDPALTWLLDWIVRRIA